jgi:hypothetical protein
MVVIWQHGAGGRSRARQNRLWDSDQRGNGQEGFNPPLSVIPLRHLELIFNFEYFLHYICFLTILRYNNSFLWRVCITLLRHIHITEVQRIRVTLLRHIRITPLRHTRLTIRHIRITTLRHIRISLGTRHRSITWHRLIRITFSLHYFGIIRNTPLRHSHWTTRYICIIRGIFALYFSGIRITEHNIMLA